jgi:hypothetical protein
MVIWCMGHALPLGVQDVVYHICTCKVRQGFREGGPVQQSSAAARDEFGKYHDIVI